MKIAVRMRRIHRAPIALAMTLAACASPAPPPPSAAVPAQPPPPSQVAPPAPTTAIAPPELDVSAKGSAERCVAGAPDAGPRAKARLAKLLQAESIASSMDEVDPCLRVISELAYEPAIVELLGIMAKGGFQSRDPDVRQALLRMPRATEKHVVAALQAEPRPRPPKPSMDPGDPTRDPYTLTMNEEVFLRVLGDNTRVLARNAIVGRLQGETDKARRAAILELALPSNGDDMRLRAALVDAIMTTPSSVWSYLADGSGTARGALVHRAGLLHDPIVFDALVKFVSTSSSARKDPELDNDVFKATITMCRGAGHTKMPTVVALSRPVLKGKIQPCSSPEIDKALAKCRDDAKCWVATMKASERWLASDSARRAALHGDTSTLRDLVDHITGTDELDVLYTIGEAVESLGTKVRPADGESTAAYIEAALAKRGLHVPGPPREAREHPWAMPLFMSAARIRARSLP